MQKRRMAAVAAALVIAGAVAGLWAARERLRNRLAVENESGQPLALLRVRISGEDIVFRDVPAGGGVSVAFSIRSDDHFAVEGRLADGTDIRGEFGYVTNGMSGQRVRFIVMPGGKV